MQQTSHLILVLVSVSCPRYFRSESGFRNRKVFATQKLLKMDRAGTQISDNTLENIMKLLLLNTDTGFQKAKGLILARVVIIGELTVKVLLNRTLNTV